MMSEPTSRALWGRGAGCLSSVGTYIPGGCGAGVIDVILLWCIHFSALNNLNGRGLRFSAEKS